MLAGAIIDRPLSLSAIGTCGLTIIHHGCVIELSEIVLVRNLYIKTKHLTNARECSMIYHSNQKMPHCTFDK